MIVLSRYIYYSDEGLDQASGARTTETYLEQAAINLCQIFQVNEVNLSTTKVVPAIHTRRKELKSWIDSLMAE